MKIIIASGNQHKIEEIRKMLPDYIECIGYSQDVLEDGNSFIENATIKAMAISKLFPDDYVLADDSGICIHALNQQPGIYSARFLPDLSYEQKNQHIIDLLENSNQRNAYFACAIAFVKNCQILYQNTSYCYGKISKVIGGEKGFGYDPIFIPNNHSLTFAQDEDYKQKHSHRSIAITEWLKYVAYLFE